MKQSLVALWELRRKVEDEKFSLIEEEVAGVAVGHGVGLALLPVLPGRLDLRFVRLGRHRLVALMLLVKTL